MATVTSYYEEVSEQGVSLGTVHSFLEKNGTVRLNPFNLARPDKQVVVKLYSADKLTFMKLIASKPVSALLRSQEITLSNLLGFPVKENIAKDGNSIRTISMPGDGQEISYEEKALKIDKWIPEPVSHEDLIRF